MKKKIFLMSLMIVALICVLAISVFADDRIASKTENEEYGTVIQLNSDPGLDNASQYVSTLKKINDSGDSTQDYCILTDGTYFYVFPSSYIVDERADGRFDLIATQLATAMAEFNTANGTSYYEGYAITGSGGGKCLDAIVRFEFSSDIKFAHQDTCCMRKYGKLVEIRINHPIDFSNANQMFYQNSSLTTVIGLEKATGLATNMFGFCPVLLSICIPTDTVKIPDGMFFSSSSKASSPFTIINLSECTQLTTIGADAFRDSKKINILIPDSVTTIETRAFQATAGSVAINKTSRLQTIANDAFYSCTALMEFYVPSTVISIGSGAFNRCTNLLSLENFENCQITIIADNTFSEVSKLKSIKIPETVTTIGSAFDGNTALKTIYIPKSVTSIADTFIDSSYNKQSADAVYIYTGSDASVLSACARLAGANVIPASKYVETNTYTGINLVVGYSHCVAYNNGAHGNAVVNSINVVTYCDPITVDYRCSLCEMDMDDREIPAIFELLGYSTDREGVRLVAGYKINEEAYNAYAELTDIELSYGVVAYIPNEGETTCNPLEAQNGAVSLVDKEHTIHADLTENECKVFDFIITGFDATQSVTLAMCAYVFDGKEINYLCAENGSLVQYESAQAVTVYNGTVVKA